MKNIFLVIFGIILGVSGYYIYGVTLASHITSDFEAQLVEYCNNLSN